MINVKTLWLVCLLLGLLFGCKSRKLVDESRVSKKDAQKAFALALEKRPQFKTMSLAGKAEADILKENLSANFNYRIHLFNDSLIWMRFSKLGIEAVRILITRDSVFMRNNLEETYQKAGYDLAKEFTGLDVNFDMLEDLILGNVYQIPKTVNFTEEYVSPLVYSGKAVGTTFYYSIDLKNTKLVQLEAINPMQKQHTIMQYGDFESYGSTLVPQSGKLTVISPEDVRVSFRHNRITLNPESLSANFSIPQSYKRAKD